MRSPTKSVSTAVLLVVSLIAAERAWSDDRTAEAILKDLESFALPKVDAARTKDQAYVREYISKRQEARDKRAGLILELYKSAPRHDRIPKLMVERWSSVRPNSPKIDEILMNPAHSRFRRASRVLAAFSQPKMRLT
jgi:hypothetical protein